MALKQKARSHDTDHATRAALYASLRQTLDEATQQLPPSVARGLRDLTDAVRAELSKASTDALAGAKLRWPHGDALAFEYSVRMADNIAREFKRTRLQWAERVVGEAGRDLATVPSNPPRGHDAQDGG